jgi:hypothetical protein
MAEVDEDRASLGPWANADLGKTARRDAGIGADEGLPLDVRFTRNVATLVRRRRATPGADKDPNLPAIFLLQPVPVELEPGKAAKRVPMLDNGRTAINGRVWFVGGGPANGHYIDYEAAEDDDIFRLITDMLRQGSTPAILFDPRLAVPEARFYPRGLSEPDSYQTIAVSDADVTLDGVVRVVDAIYRSCLVTPEVQSKYEKLWHNQDKWWPSQKAETLVQGKLHAGLAGAFPTCTVRPEQTMAEGRLDLQIEQSEPLDRSKITLHAVLELKVLRDFGETGATFTEKRTLEWVESGVKQAGTYRTGKGAKWSALFCFDMRKENTGEKCFDHVRELAARLNVFLKSWFLYAKSTHYRSALASNA